MENQFLLQQYLTVNIMLILIVICVLILFYFSITPRYTGGDDIDPVLSSKLQILRDCDSKSFNPFCNISGITGKDIYAYKSGILAMGCHHGQRKLTLSEIQFLTACGGGIGFAIYIGSAPCEHLPILRKLYPDIKFLLIDPHYHAFDSDHIYVYQNTQAIDIANRAKFSAIIKGSCQDDPRAYNNAMRLTNALFYKSGERANLMNSMDASTDDYDVVKNARDSFWESDHLDLVTDVMNGSHMIYIIQDYMTNDLAKLLKKSVQHAGISDWVLISDMRTDMIYPRTPSDLDFVWNDAIQMSAIKILRPKFSMIKFHPPYYAPRDIPVVLSLDNYTGSNSVLKMMAQDIKYCKTEYNLDMIAAYRKRKHMYINHSDIYLQAWSRPTSAETRLIISRQDIDRPYRNYDNRLWDQQFAYLNTIRGYAYFGDFYELVKTLPGNKYCGCFDCMLELLILGDYATSAPRTSPHIDVPRILRELKISPEKIKNITNIFNETLLYGLELKCSFHNQLVKPPVNLYLYQIRHEFGKYILYQRTHNKSRPVLEVTIDRTNRYTINYKKLGPIKIAENFADIICEDTLQKLAVSITKNT